MLGHLFGGEGNKKVKEKQGFQKLKKQNRRILKEAIYQRLILKTKTKKLIFLQTTLTDSSRLF